MKLRDFIKQFSHNNIIRLLYKHEGGHICVGESWNDTSMDWEVNNQQGVFRDFINNEVLGLATISFRSGDSINVIEALNIVIEKLDEQPFSGLDVGNIEKVKQSFQRIGDAHELNTIIFSTHDIRLAVEMADSIYIVGFPEGVTDYSTIVGHFDLKKMGLAWEEYGEGHRQLVADIKELLLKS